MVPVTVTEFDETDSGLSKTTGQQALLAEGIIGAGADTVKFQSFFGFARGIHQFRQSVLHAETKLEGFNDALDTGSMLFAGKFGFV